MKRRSFRKTIFREIRQSFSRFLAIFAIVALGVGFLSGLLAATPDMRDTMDDYYRTSRMMDLRLLSTLGLTQEDVQAVKQIDGVGNVMPAYSVDAQMVNPDEDTLLARIHSLPEDTSEENSGYLNRLTLVEGRLPEKPGECVLETVKFGEEPAPVGGKLRLSDDNKDLSETLTQTEYTVVGYVHSSYYLSIEREQSQEGDGSIDLVLYVSEPDFCLSAYTDLYLTVPAAAALSTFTDDYFDALQPLKDQLDALSETRLPLRKDEVVGEATEQLNDAKQEYEEKKAETEQKLADALAELDKGRQEISDNEQKLADAKRQITEGEQQLADGKKQLEASKLQYEQGKQQYEEGKEELKDQKTSFAFTYRESQWQLYDGRRELENGKQQLEEGKQQLDSLKQVIDAAKESAKQSVESGLLTEEQAQEALQLLAPLEEQYQTGKTEYDQNLALLTEKEQELEQGEAALAEGKRTADAEFAAAQQQLDEAKAQLDGAQAAIAAAELEIPANEQRLEESKQQVEEGERQLSEARKQLADGESEYRQGKQEADDKLADAQQQLDNAQKQIDDLSDPKWYVLDREANAGYVSFESNANKIEAIAKVFPVFFFLVAALVALTTMTRMVEEERVQIGTLKALGYSKGHIAVKYMIYAGMATLAGCIFGLVVGSPVFPKVIWGAYGEILYNFPPFHPGINPPYALVSSAAAILCTMLATFSACYGVLMEAPARLMLPKAPKAGKRIFLERIKPLWSRMRFTHKVTARNLIRYKKRFFMTVIGIAGCTALLVTGFGLRDSISHIVDNQFGDIFQYNLTVSMRDAEVPQTDEAVKKVLEDKSRIDSYLPIHQESGALTLNGKTFDATFFVPQESARLSQFINLQERKSRKPVTFQENTVLLTEKLAENLGAKVGSELSVEDADGKTAALKVGGIVENYVHDYMYLSASLYESAFGGQAEFSTLIVKVPDESDANREAIASELLKSANISSAQFNTEIITSFNNMVKSINYIVIVLIVSAGLLAFVVLYNLTNINITERQKEIATIKVLGFFDKEVSSYIYRETAVLSIIGTAAGLVLGIVLHAFVVKTSEVDMVMFGRSISALSFGLSALLTLVFSALVNLVMYRKLKRISMVESMKSGE